MATENEDTQVNLVAPKGLVDQAKSLAEKLDLSLSQLIRKLLREAVERASSPASQAATPQD